MVEIGIRRFLKTRSDNRTTTYQLWATGRCIPVYKGHIFVDALEKIENCKKIGIDNCVKYIKIKYRVDEFTEYNIDSDVLEHFKSVYPEYWDGSIEKEEEKKEVIEETASQKHTRVCKKCKEEFIFTHHFQYYCNNPCKRPTDRRKRKKK